MQVGIDQNHGPLKKNGWFDMLTMKATCSLWCHPTLRNEATADVWQETTNMVTWYVPHYAPPLGGAVEATMGDNHVHQLPQVGI